VVIALALRALVGIREEDLAAAARDCHSLAARGGTFTTGCYTPVFASQPLHRILAVADLDFAMRQHAARAARSEIEEAAGLVRTLLVRS